MPTLTINEIDVRSYAAPFSDAHDFAQMVLPLKGRLTLDINGAADIVHPLRAGFIAPGLLHTQFSREPNQSLILDFDLAAVPPETAGRLAEQPYAPISAAAGKLIDFMGILHAQGAAGAAVLIHWTPLLLDALTRQPLQPASRLQAALTRFEAAPGQAWTTDSMARVACLSVSSLHRVFRQQLDTTPQAWLSAMRLRFVCRQLAASSLPIAQLATQAGYADQSALTHAMRRALDITPLAYRQQNQTKIR